MPFPYWQTLPPSRLCAADTAYDSNALRAFLTARGTEPVIPNNPTRKHIQPSKAHRAEVERKIADLQSLKAELDRMIDQCGHGVVADCRIIETLSPHQTSSL